MSTIAVVGAGITGVTTAYALLERGHSVILVDSHRYPAMETSFANGGQLSASNAEVWNSWSTIAKSLKWMLRPDAPLLVNPRPSFHKYSWMAEFVGQIRGHRANTVATTRLAISARSLLFGIADREDIAFDLERRGILHIYRGKSSFDAAARANALLGEGGLDRYAVTAAEIAAIEPAVTGKFHGGFYTPSDATGDIHKFTRGLAKVCERRGARLVMGATVIRMEPNSDGFLVRWRSTDGPDTDDRAEVDAIVICAGVASRRLATMMGDRINIYPVKGYSITIGLKDDRSVQAAPWVSLLDDDAKIVTSRLGADRFRVAGTAEFNGENRDIRTDRIRPLLKWSQALFPAIETSAVVPWAGLRPMTPNMMPRVRPGRRPGVFYNTGHGHLGWTLSAATAEIAADQVHGYLTAA